MEGELPSRDKDPRQARRPHGKQATALRCRKMRWRVTRVSRVKGLPNVAEVMKPLRRVVLKLSPVGRPPAIFAGHFSAPREMAFSFPG